MPNSKSLDHALQALRQAFFAYRNGVVAESLRRCDDPHKFIMGCQLADLIQITSGYPHDAELAQTLWDDRQHRECRLSATMLYPAEEMSADTALRWARDVQSIEEADILCHRLLRHTASATSLWRTLIANEIPLLQYTALRLLLNLLIMKRETDSGSIGHILADSHLATFQAITALRQSIEEEISGDSVY